MMYFNERSDLNQPQYKQSANDSRLIPDGPPAYGLAGPCPEHNRTPVERVSLGDPGQFQASDVLNAANNRLQELMQLLYLLSRDPAVPNDARYHVTLAQSEIALLVRIMRNAEDAHNNATNPSSAGPAASLTNL